MTARPRSLPAARGSEAPSDVAVAVALLLGRCARDFGRRVKRCRKLRDAETIHQIRVQARRLAVWCDLLGALGAGPRAAEVRKRIKKLIRSLSRLRDSQVQQELLREAPVSATAAVARVRRVLRREEPQWAERVQERCRAMHPVRMEELLREASRPGRLAKGRGPEAVAEGVHQWLAELHAEACRRLRPMRAGEPATLHHFRIAVKHLRYGLEVASAVTADIDPAWIRRLCDVQVALGDIQDAEVCRIRVDSLVEEHPDWAADLGPLRAWLVRRRDLRIRRVLARRARLLPRLGALAVVRQRRAPASSAA